MELRLEEEIRAACFTGLAGLCSHGSISRIVSQGAINQNVTLSEQLALHMSRRWVKIAEPLFDACLERPRKSTWARLRLQRIARKMSTKQEYLPTLDGCRAVAIMALILDRMVTWQLEPHYPLRSAVRHKQAGTRA